MSLSSKDDVYLYFSNVKNIPGCVKGATQEGHRFKAAVPFWVECRDGWMVEQMDSLFFGNTACL